MYLSVRPSVTRRCSVKITKNRITKTMQRCKMKSLLQHAANRKWCITNRITANSDDLEWPSRSFTYCKRFSSVSRGTLPPGDLQLNLWMNEWKCEDFKCVWKPTESRLCLTHYVNKSSRWAKCIVPLAHPTADSYEQHLDRFGGLTNVSNRQTHRQTDRHTTLLTCVAICRYR